MSSDRRAHRLGCSGRRRRAMLAPSLGGAWLSPAGASRGTTPVARSISPRNPCLSPNRPALAVAFSSKLGIIHLIDHLASWRIIFDGSVISSGPDPQSGQRHLAEFASRLNIAPAINFSDAESEIRRVARYRTSTSWWSVAQARRHALPWLHGEAQCCTARPATFSPFGSDSPRRRSQPIGPTAVCGPRLSWARDA